ncbi:MAG: sugar phosphate isomerase/epimerase family protein [Verrucomicrobiota bacterium]
MKNLSRRQMLFQTASTVSAMAAATRVWKLRGASHPGHFRIGACDWSIGKLADPSGVELAKKIGLDGLQVSLGTLPDGMKLRQAQVQQQYRDASKQHGVALASLAIGEMNNIPYKNDPRAEQWVSDSIDVCSALGCRAVLLAFFSKGDLKGDKPGTDEVVRRLRQVAPKAEKAGVVLGVESWLSAEEQMDILQRVGSPSVQVYYDVANSHQMGYDIYREIRWLGRKHICEFHMKENGALLGQGVVDFGRVREALDDIGYEGWMQIEGAVPAGQEMFESYQKNCAFLKRVFASD